MAKINKPRVKLVGPVYLAEENPVARYHLTVNNSENLLGGILLEYDADSRWRQKARNTVGSLFPSAEKAKIALLEYQKYKLISLIEDMKIVKVQTNMEAHIKMYDIIKKIKELKKQDRLATKNAKM